MQIKIKGLNKTLAGLQDLEGGIDRKFAAGLNQGIALLEGEAAKAAPVDTGLLRNTREIKTATPTDLEAAVEFDVEYAAAVHEKNPFAQDTVEDKAQDAVDLVANILLG